MQISTHIYSGSAWPTTPLLSLYNPSTGSYLPLYTLGTSFTGFTPVTVSPGLLPTCTGGASSSYLALGVCNNGVCGITYNFQPLFTYKGDNYSGNSVNGANAGGYPLNADGISVGLAQKSRTALPPWVR